MDRNVIWTTQKMKFSIKDFFSKCEQIRRKLRIWSQLLKKSLIENFIFWAVLHLIFFLFLLLLSLLLAKPFSLAFYFKLINPLYFTNIIPIYQIYVKINILISLQRVQKTMWMIFNVKYCASLLGVIMAIVTANISYVRNSHSKLLHINLFWSFCKINRNAAVVNSFTKKGSIIVARLWVVYEIFQNNYSVFCGTPAKDDLWNTLFSIAFWLVQNLY